MYFQPRSHLGSEMEYSLGLQPNRSGKLASKNQSTMKELNNAELRDELILLRYLVLVILCMILEFESDHIG